MHFFQWILLILLCPDNAIGSRSRDVHSILAELEEMDDASAASSSKSNSSHKPGLALDKLAASLGLCPPAGNKVASCENIPKDKCGESFVSLPSNIEPTPRLPTNSDLGKIMLRLYPYMQKLWGARCIATASGCSNPDPEDCVPCILGVSMMLGPGNVSAPEPGAIVVDRSAPRMIVNMDELIPYIPYDWISREEEPRQPGFRVFPNLGKRTKVAIESGRDRAELTAILLAPLAVAMVYGNTGRSLSLANIDQIMWLQTALLVWGVLETEHSLAGGGVPISADNKRNQLNYQEFAKRLNGRTAVTDVEQFILEWEDFNTMAFVKSKDKNHLPAMLMHSTKSNPLEWKDGGKARRSIAGTYDSKKDSFHGRGKSFYSAADFVSLTNHMFLAPSWGLKHLDYVLDTWHQQRVPLENYILVLKVMDPKALYKAPVNFLEGNKKVANLMGAISKEFAMKKRTKRGSMGSGKSQASLVTNTTSGETFHLLHHMGETDEIALKTKTEIKHTLTVQVKTDYYRQVSDDQLKWQWKVLCALDGEFSDFSSIQEKVGQQDYARPLALKDKLEPRFPEA